MRHKILKAYRSNPILSIHVFAVVYFFVIYAALEILHIICKRELISGTVRDFIMTFSMAGIWIWLSLAARRCSQVHRNDETKLTYIALKIYAFANYIAGSVCLLTSLITLVGVLTGSVIL